VHQLVNKWNFDNIKMDGGNVKIGIINILVLQQRMLLETKVVPLHAMEAYKRVSARDIAL
jgi:hypothetical protein